MKKHFMLIIAALFVFIQNPILAADDPADKAGAETKYPTKSTVRGLLIAMPPLEMDSEPCEEADAGANCITESEMEEMEETEAANNE